jgi:hypothetical protein
VEDKVEEEDKAKVEAEGSAEAEAKVEGKGEDVLRRGNNDWLSLVTAAGLHPQ